MILLLHIKTHLLLWGVGACGLVWWRGMALYTTHGRPIDTHYNPVDPDVSDNKIKRCPHRQRWHTLFPLFAQTFWHDVSRTALAHPDVLHGSAWLTETLPFSRGMGGHAVARALNLWPDLPSTPGAVAGSSCRGLSKRWSLVLKQGIVILMRNQSRAKWARVP